MSPAIAFSMPPTLGFAIAAGHTTTTTISGICAATGRRKNPAWSLSSGRENIAFATAFLQSQIASKKQRRSQLFDYRAPKRDLLLSKKIALDYRVASALSLPRGKRIAAKGLKC